MNQTLKKLIEYIAPNGAFVSALVTYHIGCGTCEIAYAKSSVTRHWEH
jgi:hypothetical protein